MTRREEIREGIAKIEGSYIVADALLTYLDAQGVMIKVERELPQLFVLDPTQTNKDWQMFRRAEEKDMAGLVSVEPLVDDA